MDKMSDPDDSGGVLESRGPRGSRDAAPPPRPELPGHGSQWLTVLQLPADQAAPRLLGARLRSRDGVEIRITEVEAYTGTDEASHAFRGPTARNAPMFADPGHIYVYLSYGIHRCVNIVAHPAGSAGGVLLRAAEVVDGHELARSRRPPGPDHRLASGPGRLGKVLGAQLSDSGSELFGAGLLAFSAPPAALAAKHIAQGTRIGISKATQRTWRWWVASDPTVSR
jgi:DNA-3-methyladenine glycosylase